jgi:cell division protease FtsH
MQMPTEDRYLLTKEELADRLAVTLGGRAAEMVVYNVASTGASDDIKRATELARRMVTEFGMSDKLGVVRYAGDQLQFLDTGEVTVSASQATLRTIDEEVQRIVDEQYERARQLLTTHRGALDRLSRRLLEVETVDGDYVKEVLAQTA